MIMFWCAAKSFLSDFGGCLGVLFYVLLFWGSKGVI